MLLIVLEERRIMKEIKKENIVKKVTLTEEEMNEVTGGARVNGFVGRNISKGIFYWTRNIWK